jgi:hypothetical protein
VNQGKRHIRLTLITLAGLIVVLVSAARLQASTVDADTPQWLRTVMSLGLASSKKGTTTTAALPVANSSQAMTLAELRNFTGISVEGDFSVELVGAPEYKVSLDGASTGKWALDWGIQEDGLVRIKGGAGTEGGVLRVETPVLANIEATGLRHLTVRDITAPELSLRMKNVAGVNLEENAVSTWILHSETPVVVQAERLTSSGVFTIRTSGYVTIIGPGKHKTIVRGGSGGSALTIHTRK